MTEQSTGTAKRFFCQNNKNYHEKVSNWFSPIHSSDLGVGNLGFFDMILFMFAMDS